MAFVRVCTEAGTKPPAEDGELWAFMTDEDEIATADVPEPMRVDVAHTEGYALPDLFRRAVPGSEADTVSTTSLQIWGETVPPGFESLECVKCIMGVHKERNGVTSRALGDAWRAATAAMQWLAPIVLPASPSARMRRLRSDCGWSAD